MMNKHMKRVGLGLTIIGYVVVYIPLIMIATYSFDRSERLHYNLGFTMDWYKELFGSFTEFPLDDGTLAFAIFNTLQVAVISTIIATICGTFIAIGINALSKNKRVRMMILNNIPVINPDIVTGVSLWVVIGLLPISFGVTTVLIAHVFFSIPFVVLTVLPKLKEIDVNLFDAALDLGCNRFQAIYKVILPAISSSIIAGSLIAFTMSIDDFIITYFVSGEEFLNVSTYIYNKVSRGKVFSPATYSYNTIIVMITITGLFIYNLKNVLKKRRVQNEKNVIIS